jgi:hypothetical protein
MELKKIIILLKKKINGNNFVLLGKENVICNDEDERVAWVLFILNEKDELCKEDTEGLSESNVCWLEYNNHGCRAILLLHGGNLLCRVVPTGISKNELMEIVRQITVE